MKKFLCIVLLATILAWLPATNVQATSGFGSRSLNVLVDGRLFELPAYGTDGDAIYIRLADLAYILRGTPAQFDMRTPIDGRWDFWVMRGDTYTPAGTELQPMQEYRHGVIGSYGFAGGYGFDGDPFRTMFIGVDGTDQPMTTIVIPVIVDIDDIFFDLQTMAHLLGFSYAEWNVHGPIREVADLVIFTDPHLPQPIPVETPEFVRLMHELGGDWIDQVRFDNQEINESIVWPVEFRLSLHGLQDLQWGSTPVSNQVGALPWGWWYPMSKRDLGNGLIELTVDQPEVAQRAWNTVPWNIPSDELNNRGRFYNHRIIVDTTLENIEQFTLYIGDTAHTMVRHRWTDNIPRYNVEPLECGSIKLLYLVRSGTFSAGDTISIYRATYDHRGWRQPPQLIYTHENVGFNDRILFEFIDHDVQYGNVYYYNVWRTSQWGHTSHISIAHSWNQDSMRVDTRDILDAPPEVEEVEEIEEMDVEVSEDEVYEPDEDEEEYVPTVILPQEPLPTPTQYTPPNRGWIWIAVMAGAVALFVIGVMKWPS